MVDLTKGLPVQVTGIDDRENSPGKWVKQAASCDRSRIIRFFSRRTQTSAGTIGHIPGKDNGRAKYPHAGEEGGICHRLHGKAPVVFTMSGTLYEDRAGRKPLQGEGHTGGHRRQCNKHDQQRGRQLLDIPPIASNPFCHCQSWRMIDALYYYD